MPSMTYPAPTIDGATWLQRSVCEYFGAVVWVPAPVAQRPAIADNPVVAEMPAIVPAIAPSFDRSVIQYFANFPWNGLAAMTVVTPTAIVEPPMLDPAAIADWLDFEPTVDPTARLTSPAINDPGSLADFSDFF
jgi:hypothetical protein